MIGRNPKLQVELIGSCVCIFDLEKSETYELNEVAAYIWNNIEEKSIKEIVEVLNSKYKIDEKTLEDHVNKFILNAVNLEMLINKA